MYFFLRPFRGNFIVWKIPPSFPSNSFSPLFPFLCAYNNASAVAYETYACVGNTFNLLRNQTVVELPVKNIAINSMLLHDK